MSPPRTEIHDVLDALADPALLVTSQGIVEFANRAAATVAGRPLAGMDLCGLDARADAVRRYLRRCSGSAGPLVGRLVLPDRKRGESQYRCYGNVIASSRDRLILLRCISVGDNRFALLTKRITELNAELHRHLHTQAVLKETIRDRELLVREIHHRVKNNIQILLGMLSAAEHEARHQEAKTILADASRRLAAIGAIQQVLYSSNGLHEYRADEFLNYLIPQLQDTWPENIEVKVFAEPVTLPSDVSAPLALIINELATNAVKYGRSNGSDASIILGLRAIGDQVEFWIKDCGPGFELGEIDRKSSGLGLVRGLTRQLGGTFRVERDGGAHCILTIPVRIS